VRILAGRQVAKALLLGALSALSAAAAGAESTAQASQDGAQSAVWTPKELTFVYQGFTSKFSCDGLRDKMYTMLLQLGARKQDLKVTEYGCINFNRPDPFPGVKVRMSVLQPASGTSASADDKSSPPVAAHWKTVELQPDRVDFTTGSGSCELIEQVHNKVLPLFATRNVDFRSTCIPHQATPGGTSLRLEVLQPDAQKPAGTPPADQ
jgi:hypothetical protein